MHEPKIFEAASLQKILLRVHKWTYYFRKLKIILSNSSPPVPQNASRNAFALHHLLRSQLNAAREQVLISGTDRVIM